MDDVLSDEQRRRAIEVMNEYLNAPPDATVKTPTEQGRDQDQRRVHLIETELKPLVRRFLAGNEPLPEFKSEIDGINKRNELWGFKGIKGQMFFNMILNVADNPAECADEIKAAVMVPASDQLAASRIKTFAGYVKRLGEQWTGAGNTRYGVPKPGSIPFFLSYFWQIQDRDQCPVYYTNTVNTLTDLNLWQASGDLAEDYLSLKKLVCDLARLYTDVGKKLFTLYDVEHVFWFRGGDPYPRPALPNPPGTAKPNPPPKKDVLLPESYVPPIVGILPRMARNEEELSEVAKRSGITIERAFEKNINAAFTMIGYETKLLGQGKGRVPDGQALSSDSSYAILWDAKVRGGGYSMGTDDRTIREYVTTQSRELKRRQWLRNIYYLIISGSFNDDFDDTIRGIKMETDVSEVILLEAEALVAIVDAKLRAPQQVTLGPEGLQRLFSVSGILTADMVRELLI
jgi:hypothetical protein